MTLQLVMRSEVPRLWGEMVAAIRPALARERRSSWPVLDGLMDGSYEAWAISGPAQGFAVTSVGYVEQTNIKACWVIFAGGKVNGGPKLRIANSKAVLAEFERLAKSAGCQEMRLETRAAWRFVLDDYAVLKRGDDYTTFRKVLR